MKFNEFVKGAKDSIIAKSETNDCTVLALASVTGVLYEDAHEYAERIWNRRWKKGIPLALTLNRQIERNVLIFGHKVERVATKEFKPSFQQSSTLSYEVDPAKPHRQMTTLKFRTTYKKGRFLVISKGHAFAIIDGQVVGNESDIKQDKRVLLHAFQFA